MCPQITQIDADGGAVGPSPSISFRRIVAAWTLLNSAIDSMSHASFG